MSAWKELVSNITPWETHLQFFILFYWATKNSESWLLIKVDEIETAQKKKNPQKPYFATMPNAYLCEARLDVMGSKLTVTL